MVSQSKLEITRKLFYWLTISNFLYIIVLLILAGVTIANLTSENGLLAKAANAREQTLIAKYKEKIGLAKAAAIVEYGSDITLQNLKDEYDDNSQKDWVNNTEIITDAEDNNTSKIKLTTNDTYIFYVTVEGIEYKGKNGVIIENTTSVTISADPSSKTDSAVYSLSVNVTVSCTDNITSCVGYYAWKKGTGGSIGTNDWEPLTLEGEGSNQKTGLVPPTGQSVDGDDYYLWIKAIVNGGEPEIQDFGAYKFLAKPTVANLVCEMTSTSNPSDPSNTSNPTQGTVTVGADSAFSGWILEYKVNNKSYVTILDGVATTPLTTTVTVSKGDTVTVRYRKTGETDVITDLTADELKTAYTLKYNGNGATGNVPANQVQYDNRSFTVTDSEPTKDNVTFTGWNTNLNGSGTAYAANSTIQIPSGETEITLYAQWGQITASMVQYTATWGGQSITTVEQALNYLYTNLGN